MYFFSGRAAWFSKALRWVPLILLSGPALSQVNPDIGIRPVELSDRPYVFDTGEQHDIKVSVIARFERAPFAMEFLPNGDLLVVQRGVDLRIVRKATSTSPVLDPEPIPGIPKATAPNETFSLADIALHPDFPANCWLYFSGTYVEPKADEGGPYRKGRIALMRGRLEDRKISDVETIFTTDELSTATGSRIRFGNDGTVYLTVSAPFDDRAQRMDSVYGKVLRFNADGSIPPDNPFVGRADAHPAIYSYGHRDQLGITMHPETGAIITSEHGPNGGDEVNVIRPGRNYGWPLYSYGRQYDGSEISEMPIGPGIEKPLLVWVPSIAPSGLTFYQGDKFPAWKGNLFITSGRHGGMDNTGSLVRVVFNAELGELRREFLIQELHQHFRDVVEGPDGLLYALTDAIPKGGTSAVLRIEPARPQRK